MSVMMNRPAAGLLTAATALVLAASPAPAQGRGMMMPMLNRTVMPASMPNTMPMMPQTAALLAAFQRQQMALMTAMQQVSLQEAALLRQPPSAGRNVLLAALQRQQAVLTAAIQQVNARMAALAHG
jgi:hypothetical protein